MSAGGGVSLGFSLVDLVSGVSGKTTPGSANGVSGSCGFAADGPAGCSEGSLIGTTLFFFNGAAFREISLGGSAMTFMRSPVVADLGSFLGDITPSFLLLSARGCLGRVLVGSVVSAFFSSGLVDKSLTLRRSFKSLTMSGRSGAILLPAFPAVENALEAWNSSFSSPNFLLEPALREGWTCVRAGFTGFGSSCELASGATLACFIGSISGLEGELDGRSASILSLGLGCGTPVDLLGLSTLTGSSTKREVGGGPRSGDWFGFSASEQIASISLWLRECQHTVCANNVHR